MTERIVAPNPNAAPQPAPPPGTDVSKPPAPGQGAIDQAPSIASGAPAKRSRIPKYRMTVPATVRDPARDPVVITMKELTDDEMQMVAQLAKGDEAKLIVEFTKMSIHAVEDVQVRFADMEGDLYWNRWSARLRNLLVATFKKLHSTSDDEDAAFLASAEVQF